MTLLQRGFPTSLCLPTVLRKLCLLGLAGFSSLLATPVPGGTLCGTVRDAQSTAVLEGAVVLTYHLNGAWTGYSAITDAGGEFCIDPIPAGTYDLQVRVRDHLVGTLKNVEVTDGVTGVVVDGTTVPPLALAAAPNPARSGTRISFDPGESSRVRVSVHDIRGRFIRGWDLDGGGGLREFSWDLRDSRGDAVPAGIYFLRLITDTGSLGHRLVRLR